MSSHEASLSIRISTVRDFKNLVRIAGLEPAFTFRLISANTRFSTQIPSDFAFFQNRPKELKRRLPKIFCQKLSEILGGEVCNCRTEGSPL
jgi:hypothetical protein